MRALLIGYGEIGKGMYDILCQYHEIIVHDPNKGRCVKDEQIKDIDVLLVAIPYSIDFEEIVRMWQQDRTKAGSTIIFSTVPIGTCAGLNACHFPIEAKHPYITRDVLLAKTHIFGGNNSLAFFFLRVAKFGIIVYPDSRHTEFLKLRSTAYYGHCIEFARYSKEVADKIGLVYDNIIEYDNNYNDLVLARGTPKHMRPVLTPPKGDIGGHCVVPNARLLDKQFPNDLLKQIYKIKEVK